jgi:hypothetical protein
MVAVTVGEAAVVKLDTKLLASPVPCRFWAPVVIVMVYVVLGEKPALGVKVAVEPEEAAVPATEVPPAPVNVKVVLLIDEKLIASLKFTVMICPIATLVAALAGFTDITEGAGWGGVTGFPPEPQPDINTANMNMVMHGV